MSTRMWLFKSTLQIMIGSTDNRLRLVREQRHEYQNRRSGFDNSKG
jgi:hypothetical protein